MLSTNHQTLPVAAPATVLAVGAFLKNAACLLQGAQLSWSALHGDLSTPQACAALDDSLEQLVVAARGPVQAVAHDLHPDFPSTHLAHAWARRLGVPAIGVQHHHAHIAVLQAEKGWQAEALLGLALDGVGLGDDGQAWGGELLRVQGASSRRLAHLPALRMPGGDVAAREPWRLAAAVLHAVGRADEIVPRFAAQVGEPLARGVRQMLDKDLHCPPSTAAGRWFDAAAGALKLSVRQTQEAEAAMALESAAQTWLAEPGAEARCEDGSGEVDLPACVAALCDEADVGLGAARFHRVLARYLAEQTIAAGRRHGINDVALGGGCFFNRILSDALTRRLWAAGLQVHRPRASSVGDSSLALGQAWVAAQHVAAQPRAQTLTLTLEC
jgi:hydrogenase maturation protein HypF